MPTSAASSCRRDVTRPHRLEVFAIVALVCFSTLAAYALRTWGGYPLDPSDERNWIGIAAEVAKGVDAAISGPLHFATTQSLARWAAITHADALAVLGIVAIPLVLTAYVACYRLMGFRQTWLALAVLTSSTYFWAPLLESRPQQWGQALVLLICTLAWRLFVHQPHPLNPRHVLVWVGWSALLLFTCWLHLLSGPIAFGVSVLLATGLLALKPRRWPGVVLWAVAALPGVWVLVWPDGPYRAMLRGMDLARFLPPLMWWPVAAIVLLFVLAGVRLWGAALLAACLRSLESRRSLWVATAVFSVVCLLALQAYMLPALAWASYKGSVLLFCLRQLGNLFFFAMFLHGLLYVALDSKKRLLSPWPGQFALLACMALLAGLALALSVVTRDTNWMLRIINYSLPIAAPFAAVGIARWHTPALLKVAVLALLAGISLGTAGGIV